MEFLDDLIKKQDDEEQPEPENAPENTSWDDLLNTIDLEDSQEIDAPGEKIPAEERKRQHRQGTHLPPGEKHPDLPGNQCFPGLWHPDCAGVTIYSQ